ncbi:MAG: penicillin-binding protein 2 [Burkholderiaceae bacterium]|nr:penicillin-binding protein 2 [Burkholderiaceae bacterium]
MSSGRHTIAYSASPLLASRTPVWRSRFVLALLALAFAGLAGRAVYVQLLGNDFFQKQGEARFARNIELPASRGRVLDRNGLILASSVPAYGIWADGADVNNPQLGQLAKLLDMSKTALTERIKRSADGFVYLKRQVDEPTRERIKALNITGVSDTKEYKRQYPEAQAAAHVVGFTNIENKGIEGIELAFNTQLSGHSGSRRVLKDRMGSIIEDLRDVIPPVNGKDIQLSIDSKVQFFAYDQLRNAVQLHNAKSGSAVVLDAQSGEVLALANYPSYDPSARQNLSGDTLRNRSITDTFEPGSTMKPFVVALALDSGVVTPQTRFETAPGYINIGRHRISDSHEHGVLTVSEIVEKSSNVGTVKISMELPAQAMWQTFTQVGIGQKPVIPFPGAASGRLRNYESWRPVEKATMSYGYGLSASVFQLAHAYTVFARNGDIAPLTMLKTNGPVAGIPVFSPQVAAQVRTMLALATGDEGTAPKAQTLGYSVAGKTGTARKVEGKGYANKYRAFFVGYAPADKPKIVVAVMIDEPRKGQFYGGLVAAPVFSQTVQNTLRIMGLQPDQTVRPNINAVGVEESF